ncbi:MAG: TIGR03086 family protein [Chloroflexi bacterium]|nr:TIGR03086 family protein [Chloroflexota bacterium]
MASTPSLELLERALDQAGTVIAQVRPDQSRLPTPCTEFDLRALLNHIVFDVRMFAAGVSGGQPPAPEADLIGSDWAGAYDAARTALLDTWRGRGIDSSIKTRVGEFPGTWAVGQHLADLAVHAWDVATVVRGRVRGPRERAHVRTSGRLFRPQPLLTLPLSVERRQQSRQTSRVTR